MDFWLKSESDWTSPDYGILGFLVMGSGKLGRLTESLGYFLGFLSFSGLMFIMFLVCS